MSSNPIKRDFSKNQIKILRLLFEKDYLQNELQEALNTSAPNLHYHLSRLEKHNLIQKETLHKVGSAKINKISLNPSAREYIRKLLGYKNKNFTRNNASNIPNLLKKLLAAIPEVKAAAIISAEGHLIAATLPQGVDETRIAAMTAALLSLSERVIIEMKKGDFDHLYIKGSNGYLLVMQAGPNAVLLASTTHSDILSKREIKIKIESIVDDFLKKLLGTIPEVKSAAIVSAEGILKKLLAAIPEVKATAIISAEGLPIASALPQGVDETRIAAMTAALLSLSERAIIEMKKGEFEELYVKGSDGSLLISNHST